MELKELIQTRVETAFHPEILRVIDESHQHHGHVAHQAGARHFAIEIRSSQFASMSRIEAHRQIYALFTDIMPHPLHALRIVFV